MKKGVHILIYTSKYTTLLDIDLKTLLINLQFVILLDGSIAQHIYLNLPAARQ